MFLTTGGKIFWGTNATAHMSARVNDSAYNYNMDWASWLSDVNAYAHGNNSDGGNCTEVVVGGNPCWVIGAYMTRPDTGTGPSFQSYRWEQSYGKAVASDALWGFYHRYGDGADDTFGSTRGASFTPYAHDTPEHLTDGFYTSNHDRAYNVLFTDGAAKMFADGAALIFKAEVVIKQANQGRPPTADEKGGWYRLYFDSLYIQD